MNPKRRSRIKTEQAKQSKIEPQITQTGADGKNHQVPIRSLYLRSSAKSAVQIPSYGQTELPVLLCTRVRTNARAHREDFARPFQPQRREKRRDFRTVRLRALGASAVEQAERQSSKLANILGYCSAEAGRSEISTITSLLAARKADVDQLTKMAA